MDLKAVFQIVKTVAKLVLCRGIYKSYAQNGEDAMLRAVIGNKRKGFYVEVGAFHPIQYSNTYALYRRGWRGVVIDANPDPRILFKVFRPGDIFVNAAIADVSGIRSRTYHRFSDSAYNTLSDEQAREWQAKGVKLVGTEEVRCVPLSRIITENKVRHIDLLSIDAEGLDLEVLKSHDWSIETESVIVESHGFRISEPQRDLAYVFLIKRGYELAAYAGFSLIFKKSA